MGVCWYRVKFIWSVLLYYEIEIINDDLIEKLVWYCNKVIGSNFYINWEYLVLINKLIIKCY